MINDLFISYPTEHRAFASRLAWHLRCRGLKIWIDLDHLVPGRHVDAEINSIIESSAVFLYIFSKHSLTKTGYQKQELDAATKFSAQYPDKLTIIPISLQNTSPKFNLFPGTIPLNNVFFNTSWTIGFKKLLSRISFLKRTDVPNLTSLMENTRWVWPDKEHVNHYIFDFRKNGELWYINNNYRFEWNDRPIYDQQLTYDEFQDPPFIVGDWAVDDQKLLLNFDQFVYNVGFTGSAIASFSGTLKDDEISGDFSESFHAWPHEKEQKLFLCTRETIRGSLDDCYDYQFYKKNLKLYERYFDNKCKQTENYDHFNRIKSMLYNDLYLPDEEFLKKFHLEKRRS